MATKPVVRKFDKSVDSGPLPEGESKETRETIQGERVRRQVQSASYPKPGKMKMDGKMSEQLRSQLKRRMRKG